MFINLFRHSVLKVIGVIYCYRNIMVNIFCLTAFYLSHFTAQEVGKGGLADEEIVI